MACWWGCLPMQIPGQLAQSSETRRDRVEFHLFQFQLGFLPGGGGRMEEVV